MTFEEFFKKKKINLTTFEGGEAGLFTEFKKHYYLMGEKSFDHTKKYWFNKLRRLYPAPPEIKAEKLVMENQLAEQTVIETLTAPSTEPAKPKTGFTPRFKAAATKQKTEDEPAVIETGLTEKTEVEAPVSAVPKVGFTPRFKAGVTKPKTKMEPTTPAIPPEQAPETPHNVEPPLTPTPKVGFTPRFKAGVTKPKPPEGTGE